MIEGTMKVVINNDCKQFTRDVLFTDTTSSPYKKSMVVEFHNVDDRGFTAARNANKIVNDYAVTQLPFILLVDTEGSEYAAVYSEEGPITFDRINDKL